MFNFDDEVFSEGIIQIILIIIEMMLKFITL